MLSSDFEVEIEFESFTSVSVGESPNMSFVTECERRGISKEQTGLLNGGEKAHIF